MILGRCGISSTYRYLTKLCKKHYSGNCIQGSCLIDNTPLSSSESLLNRSDRISPILLTLPARMASSSAGDPSTNATQPSGNTNMLMLEKSPYLLQHATNPVEWYPWGDEALAKAQSEDKMIFLSVGYSTCHWCHVMEKESFENREIAEIMNKYFVNIKVDREERPDIDKVYMTFIQTIIGHGGWPMSVFLAPDLTPIIGGTYFPPENRYGQPGFKNVLLKIAQKWRENKAELLHSGTSVIKELKRVLESKTVLADRTAPANECGLMCAQQFARLYEPKFGGFSEAPKFPQPVNMNFLFYMYARDPTSQLGRQCLDMCEYTLTKIAYGGIHDHVGQGFARYSVDEEWHVPHFEKMLYDQGQLLQSYTDAFLATKDAFFSEIMDDIVTYVSRDLRHKEGGFYSAEDADSYPTPNEKAKREGAFYVWTQDEINKLLNKEVPGRQDIKMSDVFSRHYEDPHGELTTKNVLIQRLPIEDTARHFNISDVTAKDTIKESKRLLFEARSKRPRPNLDNKIITAWNGLMISGLSRAGAATDNKRYVELATDAARFVERYLYDKSERVLLRNCYCDDLNAITQTSVPIKGFHTDYAFMVKGLLDLYEASFDPHWLEFAEELQDTQDNLFWDGANGGYFATAKDDATMILRLKDDHDGAEPCSNSIACDNLLKLSAFLNRSEFKDKAKHLLASFREILMKIPYSIPELVSALLHYHDGTMQIYIIGKRDTKETKDMIEIVRKRLIPAKILIFADHEESDNVLFKKNDVLSKMKSHNGQAMAYVCRHRKCSLPVTNPEELAALVDEK